MTVTFRLNGDEVTVEDDAFAPAFSHLMPERAARGRCDDGRCSRCVALLGDRVVPTCHVALLRLEGTKVRTRAGLVDDALVETIERAFDKVGLNRCRDLYETMVLIAWQLIRTHPVPRDDDLRAAGRALDTRCASREEFERAVRLAARVAMRSHRG